MKTLVLVLLAVCVAEVCSRKNKGKGKGKGKPPQPLQTMLGPCLSSDEVTILCAGNTTTGQKMEAASQTCNIGRGGPLQRNGGPLQRAVGPLQRTGGPLQRTGVPLQRTGGPLQRTGGPLQRAKGDGKGKGKGKGNGRPNKPSKPCPAADELFQIVADKHSEDICLMTEMGWITIENGTIVFDNDTVMVDINNLPSEVAAALTGMEFEMCVTNTVEMSSGYVEKCLAGYTEVEQDLLTGLLNVVANFKCIQHCFAKACNVYVSSYMRTVLGLPIKDKTLSVRLTYRFR